MEKTWANCLALQGAYSFLEELESGLAERVHVVVLEVVAVEVVENAAQPVDEYLVVVPLA